MNRRAATFRILAALAVLAAAVVQPLCAQEDNPAVRLGAVSFTWDPVDFRQTRVQYELRNDSDRTLLGYALEIEFQDAATGTVHRVMQAMAANLPSGQIHRLSISLNSCYAIDEVTQLETPEPMYIAGLTARVFGSLLAPEQGAADPYDQTDDSTYAEDGEAPAQSADRFAFPPYDLPPLVVAYPGYAPPYLFAPDGLEPVGFEIDVLKRIASLLGRSLVVKQSSGSVEDCLTDPEVELVGGGQRDLQPGNFRLSGAIALVFPEIIVVENNSALLAGGSALKGAIVGVPAYGPLAGKLRGFLEQNGARVFEYEDTVQALYQLRMGDYQALVEDPSLFATIVQMLGFPTDGLMTEPYTAVDGAPAEAFSSVVFALPPDSAELARAINKAIASLVGDGTLEELSGIWLKRP